jgi:beta-galactosidase
VTFSITGAGVIAAVGNRDMTSEEPYQGSRRRLFHGMALAVVRSSGKAGAPGLKGSVLQLASR